MLVGTLPREAAAWRERKCDAAQVRRSKAAHAMRGVRHGPPLPSSTTAPDSCKQTQINDKTAHATELAHPSLLP